MKKIVWARVSSKKEKWFTKRKSRWYQPNKSLYIALTTTPAEKMDCFTFLSLLHLIFKVHTTQDVFFSCWVRLTKRIFFLHGYLLTSKMYDGWKYTFLICLFIDIRHGHMYDVVYQRIVSQYVYALKWVCISRGKTDCRWCTYDQTRLNFFSRCFLEESRRYLTIFIFIITLNNKKWNCESQTGRAQTWQVKLSFLFFAHKKKCLKTQNAPVQHYFRVFPCQKNIYSL